jgi:hypothetical protein
LDVLRHILAQILHTGVCSVRSAPASESYEQIFRAWPQLLADVILEAFAGILVGILYVHIEFVDLAKFIFIMALALGLTISISSLRVFGKERVVYWREAAPGAGMNLNKLAYFVAKNVVELPRLLLLTFFFVMSFYPIVTPVIQWWQFVSYAFAASFACSGIAYLASVALDPLTAQLLTVIWVIATRPVALFPRTTTTGSFSGPRRDALLRPFHSPRLAERLPDLLAAHLPQLRPMVLRTHLPPNRLARDARLADAPRVLLQRS